MAAGAVLLTHRGPVSGIFSAECLDLEVSAQGWGQVVSSRHHAVTLNFAQPFKFLFLGRKLKYGEVLACCWPSITEAYKRVGGKGRPSVDQKWASGPRFKGKDTRATVDEEEDISYHTDQSFSSRYIELNMCAIIMLLPSCLKAVIDLKINEDMGNRSRRLSAASFKTNEEKQS